MNTLLEYPEVAPSEEERKLAGESARTIARLRKRPPRAGDVSVGITSDEGGAEEIVSIPAAAFRLLTEILNQMALGNAVALIPVHAELTTQQAADILNVSRPFLVKLINDNKLPFRMIGTHRRVLFKDLMAYKKANEINRSSALDELAAQSQELNMDS
jgi:excisionase family DNA binding protein